MSDKTFLMILQETSKFITIHQHDGCICQKFCGFINGADVTVKANVLAYHEVYTFTSMNLFSIVAG